MELTLDCRHGMDAIHTQLAEALAFPSWYGRNLDALHDCFTELSTPLTIRLLEPTLLPGLFQVLRDCTEENPFLTLLI